MSLVCTPKPFDNLKNVNILLDTCVIIDASENDDVDTKLRLMLEDGCTFFSLPSVREEFVCASRSMQEYGNSLAYFRSLDILLLDSTEKRLVSDDNAIFNMVLRHCKNIHPSYVDRMLLMTPHLYRNSSEDILLMTSNHKDVPLEIFDRIGFISYDDKEFHNIGIYKFNADSFDRMVATVK